MSSSDPLCVVRVGAKQLRCETSARSFSAAELIKEEEEKEEEEEEEKEEEEVAVAACEDFKKRSYIV